MSWQLPNPWTDPGPQVVDARLSHPAHPADPGTPPWPSRKTCYFDPSTRGLRWSYDAINESDPVFDDVDAQAQWQAIRDTVMAHMLRIVEASPWRKNLVLRGSVLLKAWLGKDARAPKDIDWVVIPQSMAMASGDARNMLDGLIDRIARTPSAGPATIHAKQAVRYPIWTYERADGMRITFPWQARDLPQGTIQMDFVFAQELWTPAVLTRLFLSDGAPISLLAATPELSLAWKLLWLLCDKYPQGKDLYDATLLAERVTLSPRLIECVAKHRDFGRDVSSIKELLNEQIADIEWDNFENEFPWIPSIQGAQSAWFERFRTALARSPLGIEQP